VKYLRLRLRPQLTDVPSLFTLIADSPFVTETRLVQVDTADPDRPTMLLEMDGDRERVRERLAVDELVDEFDISPRDEDRFYVHLQPETPPFVSTALEALSREGVVIVTPVVYRDGEVRARLAGEAGDLQRAVDAFPPRIAVDVEEVGSFVGGPGTVVDRLSDRQREALRIAFEAGYYENPRRATQADVAERLGCAPSTAGEHLRKAEARLVESVVGE
jgi:hypothetical protein